MRAAKARKAAPTSPPDETAARPLSSEAERRTSKLRQPRRKQAHLTSTRAELCRLDRTLLPPAA
ncbi:MAG: hypothetical protein M3Z04_11495 [Chloroflexota bacterium]|nr:hypothetical protein [Chloroflexota bacterium]